MVLYPTQCKISAIVKLRQNVRRNVGINRHYDGVNMGIFDHLYNAIFILNL